MCKIKMKTLQNLCYHLKIVICRFCLEFKDLGGKQSSSLFSQEQSSERK